MKGYPKIARALALLLFLSRGWLAADVILNEIHYEPPDETKLEEFVELYNTSAAPADISGWYISEGVRFRFPPGTTIPGEGYLVVAESPENLAKKFPGAQALGPFEGHFANDGERVVLRDASGAKVDEVDYQVRFPWPLASAGDGGSLELIHPDLENEVGGSWRASTGPNALPESRATLIAVQSEGWRFRKGTSEASDPPAAWREEAFVEDETWSPGKAQIGFGKYQNSTVLDDMMGNYTTVYLRRTFYLEEGAEVPPQLRLRIFVDDGCVAWINGSEVARLHATAGEKPFNATALSHDARWEEIQVKNASQILHPGANLLAIHALNQALASDDFTIDAELIVPARSELPPVPTPGAKNSVFSRNVPPQVRQVATTPLEPRSGWPIAVTARITDPDGVASAVLRYQVVRPGYYIPCEIPHEPQALMSTPTKARTPNPVFEDPAQWTAVAMVDDGTGDDDAASDGIYTGTIPPQENRILLRYRISTADVNSNEVTVPYPDDPSRNFACFVYDGVPEYSARVSVYAGGKGHVYPVEVMNSLPVYFLITRNYDLIRCIAYNSAWQIPKSNEAARDTANWVGTFVYNGVVYDHINYRLRQANDRYGGSGKRSWRIKFNRGRPFEALDQRGQEYSPPWHHLNIGKMFDNLRVGNFGITEELNALLWNLVDVPAPYTHTFHFRVIDGPDEVPAAANGQYTGDFWGMALAMEDYSPQFIDAHRMADGNLYKLKDGIFDGRQLKRNQGRYSVTTDADFQNIRANLRPTKTVDWLDANVNYARWYPYHTVVEAIRHYDFVPADSHSKNRAWFFEPDFSGSPYGRLWTLPWDADASWGPNWNSGIDYSTQAISTGKDKAPFRRDYRGVIREFRDLVWTQEVINPLIDDLAAVISEFAKADRDRWRGAPASEGTQDFGTLEAKVQDMKNFAFVSWSGSTGPAVPAGGRAKYLDTLASAEGDAAAIPKTPTVTSVGPAHFPIDGLVFETSPFSDPQGDGTFGAMKWRLAEVTDPQAPAYNPLLPRHLEWRAVWESEELAEFAARVAIPVGKALPGHAYRVRVRTMDATGLWGHWSAPVQFIASKPDQPLPVLEDLRITEIMYNPGGGGDQEFIEVQNTGTGSIELSGVRLGGGVEFSFDEGSVKALGPGEYAVVVKDLDVFSASYDASAMKIAGEYQGRLDNRTETVSLVFGDDIAIVDATYVDAWYPPTDGQGRSLVAADPRQALDLFSRKEGWRESKALNGSPGAPDGETPPPRGLQIPGDLNQDRRLDLTDAVILLGALFLGDAAPLPCDGAGIDQGGNRALLDENGDGAVDFTDAVHALQHLFQGGPAHILGSACTAIEGCPDVCGPTR